jgi:LysR family transcriptional regulator, regulator for metE and metH
MTLELRHLDLVQTVVEEGGLTRAGTRLGLSQSALSHQLRALEEEFGVSLFHRIGRRLVLAPAGERILRAAGMVIPEMARTEMDLRGKTGRLEGMIRLAADCYTCYQWLPGIARRFVRKNPASDIRIATAATDKPVEALLRNELDLAIVAQHTRDRRLKMIALFDDELVGVTAAGHRLAGRPYLRPKDFTGETLFASTSLSTSAVYQRMMRIAGIRPNQLSEIPLTDAVMELVRAGFGITILARWAVQPYLGSGEYCSFSLTARGLRRKWYAVIRKNENNPPDHLVAFLQALRTESMAAVARPN